jgi:ABC-type multidrug transport system fused ATPase/permease subunit
MGMGALETVGVASIMPYLSVLGDPGIIEENVVLRSLYSNLGFEDTPSFLTFLGGVAVAVILFSAVFRIVTVYAMNRYTQMRRHALSERLLEAYLRQPYAYFLSRHSGDMAKSILSEVDQLINNVIKPGMELLTHGMVALFLILFLVIADPFVALAAGGVIGGAYLLIFLVLKNELGRMGKERIAANRARFMSASEALGGIKDIKLLGREQAYLKRFRPASKKNSVLQARKATLAQVPKFLIEVVAFGGVIFLSMVLVARSDDFGSALPMLGMYAFAGYKLLPAAQHIFASLSSLRFGSAAVDDLCEDLRARETLAELGDPSGQRMDIQEKIELREVTYCYPGTDAPALNGLNLVIPKGSSVGLVGGTGAGKTTLVDVILGLLRPDIGGVFVDGEQINDDNLRSWQKTLGYVPQDIFLVDATISENIAFGIRSSDVDQGRVVECAKMAQVHDFIQSQLAEGYDTKVGERGVRLSGGQRQRIGIARALYHDPEVLVFDEATSALDNLTEKAVMEAVDALSRKKTVVMIAHRLSTVRNCDEIVLLEAGSVKAKGGYQELLASSDEFRKMAGVQ